MPELENGLWAIQYLEPQLLEDFRNYRDDFMGVLKGPNPAAIGEDGILFNKLINNVDFKVNANTDFTPVPMTGKKGLTLWDKLDTTPTLCTDKELRGMAFDKEAAIRVEHTNTFKIGVRDYVLNKLAPSENKAGMPVIRTTGAEVDGRKRLTYEDLLGFYNRLTKLNLNDKTAWHMVLSDDHRTDLMADRASTNHYRDVEINRETGEVSRFFKLRFFENNDTPYYGADSKLKSLGSTPGANDQKASIFLYAPNTVYHLESVKVLYKDMMTDTRNKDPQSEFRLHTYGLCDKKQEHGFGAIISANA
jgi:hypothetical protein